MTISRRAFLKFGAGGLALTCFGFDVAPALALARSLPIARTTEARTICPYCAVGCGVIAHRLGDNDRHARPTVTHVEGDADHPINQGSLCSKGASLKELLHDPKRLSKPLYRASPDASGSTSWREVTWDFALETIAQRIKATRDATFIARDEEDRIVNRLESAAFLGGAADTNETNYLAAKVMRSLGLVYLEQSGRLGQAASVRALEATVGLSGMMTTWIDLRNSDLILVMGGNPAETQPVGFDWALQARRQRGARLICVDPRLTRTAALADLYVPIRAGSDLALLGGLIHYTLSNGLFHADYVRWFTNASFLVSEGFDFQDGLFSGYDADSLRYDPSTWAYETGSDGLVATDPTLEHPRCVFQLLKGHYHRYTSSVVAALTGISPEVFARLATDVCSTGRADRVGTILYAAGWAQHSTGTQTIRAAAILQLLLGNIGRSGGGLNALHGHANTQGSSDHGIASEELPGHLRLPQAEHATLSQYLETHMGHALAHSTYHDRRAYAKYFISLLTAWYGQQGAVHDFGYEYLPKLGSNGGLAGLWEAMARGKVDGLLVFGANPLAGSPNVSRIKSALKRLRWLVVVDCFETETARFWNDPGDTITTEVFLLPAAIFSEKEGSMTNACRWVQWRSPLTDPRGEARADSSILASLFVHLKELYASEGGAYPDPLLKLTWSYTNPNEPQPDELAQEINGTALRPLGREADSSESGVAELLSSPRQLRADGATACGNWLYCGSFTEAGNLMARRSLSDPTGLGLYTEWAWSSPGNQRILFNRAGADRAGASWDPARPHFYWDGHEWVGDASDFGHSTLPEQSPGPFTILSEGVARLYAPSLLDGPIPEHYEPVESPVANVLHPRVSNHPLIRMARSELDKYGKASDYPVVCTTFRLAEHFHWWTPHLQTGTEWQPDFFIELPEGLARELGVRSGDPVRVVSARGHVEGRACVTKRLRALNLAGRRVWPIGIPIHWGFAGRLNGPLVNNLTSATTDPMAGVPEFKAFLVRVEKI